MTKRKKATIGIILVLLVIGGYFVYTNFEILFPEPPVTGVNVRGDIVIGYEDGTEDIITTGTTLSIYFEDKRVSYIGFRPSINIKPSWIPMAPHTSANVKIERWLYFDSQLVETLEVKTETMVMNQWNYIPWKIFAYESEAGHPKMDDLANGEHLISVKYKFTATAIDPDGNPLVQYAEMGISEIWGIQVIRQDPYTLTIETETRSAVCGDGVCTGPPIIPYALETSVTCPEDC